MSLRVRATRQGIKLPREIVKDTRVFPAEGIACEEMVFCDAGVQA